MSDEFYFKVLEALRMSVNPTKDNIKIAEELLTNTLITQDEFGYALLRIASDQTLQEKDFAVRQAAAIQLEKNVKTSWNQF